MSRLSQTVTIVLPLALLFSYFGLSSATNSAWAADTEAAEADKSEQAQAVAEPEEGEPLSEKGGEAAVEATEGPAEVPRWERTAEQWQLPEEMRLKNLKRFGQDLFTRAGGEEPRILNMPISPQYVIGPGDELAIRVWGEGIEHINTTAVVAPEGTIYLPLLGEVTVARKALGAVQDTIAEKINKFYTNSNTSVTVSSTRVVTVYVTGDVAKPGRYGLNGTATVLTALYMAGGPTKAGSLRNIRLLRGQQEPVEIDLYPYLLAGQPLAEPLLETGDTIFVGSVGGEIGVAGEVQRPARYEVNGEITCAEAIELAGGLTAEGCQENVRVWRVAEHQRQVVINVDLAESRAADHRIGAELPLQAGDVVVVAPVDRMPENAVRISGAIRRPGIYQVGETMTLGDLINNASGLDEGAYLGYGQLRRIDVYSQHHYQSFSVEDALEEGGATLTLRPYDTVRIYYRHEITPLTYVQITGPVQNPGKYEWAEDMTVKDLVMQSGGVNDEAYVRQARLLRLEPEGDRSVSKIRLQEALADAPESNVPLQPGDVLEIMTRAKAETPREVHIAGFVQRPDTYERFEGMKVSDLIFAAGGLAPGAAEVIEYAPGRQTGAAKIHELQLTVGPENSIKVEPDLVMNNDDQIAVLGKGNFAQKPPVVHVNGQVENPGAYILNSSAKKRETVYELLQRAGPLLDDANPDGIIIYRLTERTLRTGQRKNLEQIVRTYNREVVGARIMETDETHPQRTVLTEQVAINVGQVLSAESGMSIVVPPRRLSLSAWVTGIPVEGGQLLESNGEESDVVLRAGDTIEVPKLRNTVAVLGAVIRPGEVPYREAAGIDQYVSMVGGMADDAAPQRAVVVRANSAAYRGEEIKEIRRGDVIIVPSDYMVRKVHTESTWERVLKALGSVAATFLVF